MRSRLVFAAVLTACTALHVSFAHAGGFYVGDRGVRPEGRAGAFVAGADDQHAIWYNPAGLAVSQPGLLLDANYIHSDLTFTRQGYVRYSDGSNSGLINYDPVHASQLPLAIPTLVVSHNFGLQHWMFAAGVYAPNAVLNSFDDRALAPQRYSLVSEGGSLLAVVGLWAAYRVNDQLSFGLGLQALVGSFEASTALGGCPATVTCQPEDPDYDVATQIKVSPIIAPTANAGIRWQPSRYVVFGLSGQLPTWVSSPATLNVRLPSAPFYDGASVSGNRANVNFTLAPIIRVGVEVRPMPNLRAELAFVWEGWSMHNAINITPTRDAGQPNGIVINNVRGVGTYQIGPTPITRNFQDVYSVRLGGEYFARVNPHIQLVPRIGASYQTSATPTEYTSVLTFDSTNIMATAGFSFIYDKFRVDLMYAHMFADSVVLDPRDAQLIPVTPLRTSDQAPRDPVNGGRYDESIDMIGLGAQYSF